MSALDRFNDAREMFGTYGGQKFSLRPFQVRMSPEVYIELRQAVGGVNLTDLSYKLGVDQILLDPVAPVDTLTLRFEVVA